MNRVLEKYLNEGYTILIDRYVTSNMAHRGGMIDSKEERLKFYKKMELLEYELLELPRPDKTILLYLPYEYACELKKEGGRDEVAKFFAESAVQRLSKSFKETHALFTTHAT